MSRHHSPTPWHRFENCEGLSIVDDDNGHVAYCDWNIENEGEEDPAAANAAFIVSACNAHANLVSRLRLALRALNATPRFRVDHTDSAAIASEIERVLSQLPAGDEVRS
ncbi:MAG: hypothetical protein ABL904_24810 [Hyphomicrobiaceae bacterium]